MVAAVRLGAIPLPLLLVHVLNHPVTMQQPAGQRPGLALRDRRQELLDMAQVATQILQLLFQTTAQRFPARALLFGDGQIRGAGFPAIGSGFIVNLQVGAQGVDDLFTEFTCFVQQTQVGGKPDGLFDHGGI
jgi:hypothetical protein